MGAKLLPPILEGKIPAQFGEILKIPFQHSRGVSEKDYSGLILKIKSTSTGQQINLIENENIITNASEIVEFNLKDKNGLVVGQYYKIQLAYKDIDGVIGYYSTIGIFKYTAKPILSIRNNDNTNNSLLDLNKVNAYTPMYMGIYQQQNNTQFNSSALMAAKKAITTLREDRIDNIEQLVFGKETENDYLTKLNGLQKELSEEEDTAFDKIKNKLDNSQMELTFQKDILSVIKAAIEAGETEIKEIDSILAEYKKKMIGDNQPEDKDPFNEFVLEIYRQIEILKDFLSDEIPQEDFSKSIQGYKDTSDKEITELKENYQGDNIEAIREYTEAREKEIDEINKILEENSTEKIAELKEYLNKLQVHIDTFRQALEEANKESQEAFEEYIIGREEEKDKIESYFNLSDDLSSLPKIDAEIKEVVDLCNIGENAINRMAAKDYIVPAANANTEIKKIEEQLNTDLKNINEITFENISEKIKNLKHSTIEESKNVVYNECKVLMGNKEDQLNSLKTCELTAQALLVEKQGAQLSEEIQSILQDEKLNEEEKKSLTEAALQSFKQNLNKVKGDLSLIKDKVENEITKYYSDSLDQLSTAYSAFNNKFLTAEGENPIGDLLKKLKDTLLNFIPLTEYKEQLSKKESFQESLLDNKRSLYNIDKENLKKAINSAKNKKALENELKNQFAEFKFENNGEFKTPKEALENLKNEWKKAYESKDSTAADRLEKMIKVVDIIVLIRDNEELQKFIIKVIDSIWKNDEEKNQINIENFVEELSEAIYGLGLNTIYNLEKEKIIKLTEDLESNQYMKRLYTTFQTEINALLKLKPIEDLKDSDFVDNNQIDLKNYLYYDIEFEYFNSKVLWNNINDPTEKVYSYRFDIYKGEELYESSGDLIHNSDRDTDASNSFDTYTFAKELEENVHYNIQYTVRTNNDLIVSSPKYIITKMGEKDIHMNMEIIIPNIESNSPEEAEQARLNKEEGYFTIGIRFFENTNIMGTFRVLRANSLTNFQVWEEMKQFKIDDHIMQNNIMWLFDDFTVQHGVEYKYALQQISNNIYSKRKESNNTVLCDFADTFLYDGKRQLKIQFNPKVSSYKNVLLESKLDTIGGKKPFIFRNARTNYKEIPISGLISYLMDDNQMFMTDKELLLGEETSRYSTEAEQKYTNQMKQRVRSTDLTSENILSERIFKNEVLEWLTNGQPKLFRSPTEGNYIIRLLNVSLSPNDTLGRMLHTFTATGYEIAEMSYENLTKLNFITAKENNEIQLVNNSHQYNYKFNNFVSGSELSFEPTIYARFSDMAPGSSFKLTFNNNETLDIQIGLTGHYEIAQSGLISIKALSDIKEGNLEIAVKNSQLLNEIIENFNGKDYKLVSIEAKDYYRQFVSSYDLTKYNPDEGFGKIDDIAVNLSFNETKEKETKIIKKQLQAIPYLKIESRLINVVPDNANKLKTSFYITSDSNKDFLNEKDYFKSLYFYKIKRGKSEKTFYLDYAIIEGIPYTIPQRIPNGYISFGIEDFEITPEENIEIILGPGVYADVIYRVLEETYELIDTQIIEKIKEE